MSFFETARLQELEARLVALEARVRRMELDTCQCDIVSDNMPGCPVHRELRELRSFVEYVAENDGEGAWREARRLLGRPDR